MKSRVSWVSVWESTYPDAGQFTLHWVYTGDGHMPASEAQTVLSTGSAGKGLHQRVGFGVGPSTLFLQSSQCRGAALEQ